MSGFHSPGPVSHPRNPVVSSPPTHRFRLHSTETLLSEGQRIASKVFLKSLQECGGTGTVVGVGGVRRKTLRRSVQVPIWCCSSSSVPWRVYEARDGVTGLPVSPTRASAGGSSPPGQDHPLFVRSESTLGSGVVAVLSYISLTCERKTVSFDTSKLVWKLLVCS